MTSEMKTGQPLNVPAKPAKKKKKNVSLERKRARAGWLFVLPFLIGLVMIYLPLLYDSFKLSFSSANNTALGTVYTFVGWDNYREALFGNNSFTETLVKGLGELVLQIPAIVIFALFMAVLLNQKMAGRAVFRAIFFIPVVVSTGIMETLNAADVVTSSSSVGIDTGTQTSTSQQIVSIMDFQKLFGDMKIGSGLVEYVVDLVNDIYDIVNRAGVQMLIFLAGLQGISPAIYESCKIDGATGWETFWKITFPMISPMILVNMVYTIIDAFTSETNSVMAYIDSIYSGGEEVLSSAMSWIYFLIVIVAVGVVAGIISANVFYQRREH